MPVGKGRSKRSSGGGSCASTATTVVFVALCVVGVYMISPSSLFSSDSTSTTTRTAVSKSDSEATDSKQDSSTFQDNPGDLPNDAIKNDEDDNVKVSSSDQAAEVSSDDQKQDQVFDHAENLVNTAGHEIEHLEVKDHAQEDVKPQADAAVEENPEGLQGKVSEEEQQRLNEHEIQLSEESSMTHNQQTDQELVTTNTDDKSKSIQKTFETMEGQNEQTKDEQPRNLKNDEALQGETKDTQENPKTTEIDDHLAKHEGENKNIQQVQDQQVKQDTENKNIQEENKKETQPETHENPKDTKTEVSDAENEQRMEQQQRQEEEQAKQSLQHEEDHDGSTTDHEGATSKDQIEHDEANIESNDSGDQHRSNQETAGEENIKLEKQEPQTNKNDKENKPHQEKRRKKKNQKPSNEGDNSFPIGESSGIPKESKESKKAWSTQADQSDNHKERKKGPSHVDDGSLYGYSWQLCNVTAGADYIPCLDNEEAISKLRSRKHFEHRERHCPENPPTCLVPLPQGYKTPVEWPHSRDKIWYHNVPHVKLAEVKGHQNWVKLSGEFLTFPGGGTQFIHGALHYIDFLQEAVPEIAWGKRTRTLLDVGCGVASFGGYLFERDVLAISFAPKDEHEAQVQFALERGIPAISAVMGSQRLPFPSRVFDVIHCARCRVPWHVEGGALLLELNRMLRPGGYFIWSATPVYQKLEEDVMIWKEMSALTVSMCWELITIKKDKLNMVGAAIYHKPESNECYEERKHKQPPMCKDDDDPNAAWYVQLQSCMHSLPVDEGERGSQWPQEWPKRLQAAPYWLNRSQMGIYGKPAPDDFVADYEHWQRVVSKSYLSGLGISWSNVRNIMDMRAVYGGFAAALKDLKVWVLNVVNIDSPDTLPIIYERGLFGIYHDWCESFSTYPRTYDLLHADHLFSRLKKRCKLAPVMAEVDRIVRPGGKLIVRDESSAVGEVENLLKSLRWEVHLTFSKNKEGILSAQKSDWRPESYAAAS